MTTRKTDLVPVSNNGNLELSGQGLSMYDKLNEFVKNSLIEGQHYGKVPGTSKPSLFKGGAELINKEAQIIADFEIIENKIDFEIPFFAYAFKCSLYREGMKVSEGYGACSSRERKYLSDKTDKFFLYNVVMKMAKKRAYVDATITAWGLSGILTQDMEDLQSDIPREEIRDSERAEMKEEIAKLRAKYFALLPSTLRDDDTRWSWQFKVTGIASVKLWGIQEFNKAIAELQTPEVEVEQSAYDYLAEKASVSKDLIEKFFDNALLAKPELDIEKELTVIFADKNGKEARLIKKIQEFKQIPF